MFRRLPSAGPSENLGPSSRRGRFVRGSRRVDLIVKANRPSLALGPQAASPSLDATAVFRPLPWSSLTGSVFQPTWVVSAMRSVRLQRFFRSNACVARCEMRCLENMASRGTIVIRMELSLLSIKDCTARPRLFRRCDCNPAASSLALWMKEISSDAYR